MLTDDLRMAQRHLSRRDLVMKRLIRDIGPCTLCPNRNRFHALVRSIVAQQISTRAAAAIFGRLEASLPRRRLTAQGILGLSSEALRGAGLSAAKTRSLLDLAERVHAGSVPLDRLHRLADDEVIARLIPVRGIGRWTAEMFLIFALGRLDVLPVDDLGLRAGVERHYCLDALPSKAVLTDLAEPWRPYRAIGTWYIWRSFGFVPQSQVALAAPRVSANGEGAQRAE